MRIAHIQPEDNYILRVTTDDNAQGLFDVKPYLNAEVFQPLKDLSEFRAVRNGKYFIEWDCGADLSADTIMAKWVVSE
jgi:hypothetical protein